MSLLLWSLGFIVYVTAGQMVLLSSELTLRSVARKVWQSDMLYLVVSLVWPVFYVWMRLAWAKRQSGSI